MLLFSALKDASIRIIAPGYRERRLIHRTAEHEFAQEPELAVLPALLDKERDFLDVGANSGVYSYRALRHCRRVYAVEPHPGMAARLRAALGSQVRVLDMALSDRTGTAQLSIPVRDGHEVATRCSLEADANPDFEQREITVVMGTIDELRLTEVGVIKVDVEGHELATLRGAARTLAYVRPVCIVECEERHHTGGVARAFALFVEHGYAAFFLHRGQLRDGTEFDPR